VRYFDQGSSLPTTPTISPSRPTNATAWRWGTRAVSPVLGRAPSRLDYWPGVLRLGLEVCTGGAALALGWLWGHGHRVGVERTVLAAALVGAFALGWWAVGVLLSWRHDHEVVRPVHAALHTLVGRHELERPAAYLTVPRDYAEPGGRPVVVRLHPGWRDAGVDHAEGTGGERHAVESVLRSKLAGELSFDWHPHGRRPHLAVRPSPPPPALVSFADPAVRPMVSRLPHDVVLLGLGSGGVPASVRLNTEVPHLAISAATGAGKTTLLTSIGAQLAHKGWQVVVLDVKRLGYPCFEGVPGVRVLRDDAMVHAELLELSAEIDRRTHGAEGPHIAVLFDELNLTIAQLQLYWSEQHGTRSRSPAVFALHRALLMGRQLGVCMVVASQSLTVRALGGDPAVREQFTARVIGGFHTRQLWDMVCGDIARPPVVDVAGRLYVVTNGRARTVQGLLMTDDDARGWAVSGEAPPHPTVTDETPGDPTGDTVTRPRLELVSEPEGERVTLAEAARRSVVPMSAEALRQAKSRALRRGEPFPQTRREGTTETIAADELRAWYDARLSDARAEGDES